ncbi:MAG: hypothetical protein AAGC53_20840 [Actinomycetota bacterium]
MPRYTLATTLVLLAACSSGATDTSVPEPDLGSGKSDATDALSRDEALRFGDEFRSEFSGDLEFHGFRFRVAADRSFTAEVTQLGSSRGLDTTMFLFGPRQANGAFPPDALMFDNDSGFGDLSRLKDIAVEDDGEYLVVIGTVPGPDARGNYRFLLECNEDSCVPETPPADLGVCDDGVLDFAEDCIADLASDTQDPEFAVEQCTEDGVFGDFFDSLCHVGALATPAAFCQHGLDAYMETMVPVCREELRGDLPSSDLDLSSTAVSDELDELFISLEEDCFDHGFCEVDMDAWTYDGSDPSVAEAAEAIRVALPDGFDFSFSGEADNASAEHIHRFGEFAALADQMAGSTNPRVGLMSASSVPFPNVDAFTTRVFLLYPDANLIISAEETSFFD